MQRGRFTLDSNNAALEELGWNDDFANALAALGGPAIAPGRVSADFGVRFLVESAHGPVTATLSGPLRQAERRVAVGDWVGLLPGAGGDPLRPASSNGDSAQRTG